MSYSVKLEVFEGPFDLLYHLIEKNEVDIYDIPIADITRQYLEYLDELRFFDIEVASEFLVMAATLLHIKSRMLLPSQNAKDPEDEADPRQQLIERLIEYKKYKEVTGEFRKREEIFQRRLFREPLPVVSYEDHDPIILDVDVSDLCQAFAQAMKKYISLYNSDYNLKKSLEKEKVSVTDRIIFIKNTLKRSGSISFKGLVRDCATRENVIATFLALLELIKGRRIKIEQTVVFGDIIIKSRNNKGWK
ncbi:MAG: segregation and condensation protein A [Clostridia bacterium]|jgi:segregation and condensation protein A|nr:segregation/condensation protein A [Clostridiales bacterium]